MGAGERLRKWGYANEAALEGVPVMFDVIINIEKLSLNTLLAPRGESFKNQHLISI